MRRGAPVVPCAAQRGPLPLVEAASFLLVASVSAVALLASTQAALASAAPARGCIRSEATNGMLEETLRRLKQHHQQQPHQGTGGPPNGRWMPPPPPPDLASALLQRNTVVLTAPLCREESRLLAAQLLHLGASKSEQATVYITSPDFVRAVASCGPPCALQNSPFTKVQPCCTALLLSRVACGGIGYGTDAQGTQLGADLEWLSVVALLLRHRAAAVQDLEQQLKVTTIALGHAGGPAALILACGARGRRFATPNTWVTLKAPPMYCSGTSKEITARAEAARRDRELCIQLLLQVTQQEQQREARIRQLVEDGGTLNAAEAKDLGLIDEVTYSAFPKLFLSQPIMFDLPQPLPATLRYGKVPQAQPYASKKRCVHKREEDVCGIHQSWYSVKTEGLTICLPMCPIHASFSFGESAKRKKTLLGVSTLKAFSLLTSSSALLTVLQSRK
ncbi:hypothetical protein cyc_06180 [Cyclospora cayetanensis]|uniref:Uncharacterized protein n=1 Tax=Cyclospora cayetanensis TaxID=88456 RepID=A0A1D3D7F1_9EIME|nr:hypothetical protein cyc_06180 [Cyclospora cayetanensis]